MADLMRALIGEGRLLVGVEPDPEESELAGHEVLRAYLDARYLRKYVLVEGESAEQVKRAWGDSMSHVFVQIGDSPVYLEETEGSDG